MSSGARSSAPLGRRLDQWLWFARFVKSRSLAIRLCAQGIIAVNGVAVTKANYIIRVGDVVAVPQGDFRRTVRVVGRGVRRGPAEEARRLYDEPVAPVRISDLVPAWTPLLMNDEPSDDVWVEGARDR